MFRAALITLVGACVGIVLVLSACAGGGDSANPIVQRESACPLLAQLAATGQTVAHADIADPAAFNTTLRTAVDKYVRITSRLRVAVPSRLRADVDRLTAAAQQYRFDDATSARAVIDNYARSTCGASNASG